MQHYWRYDRLCLYIKNSFLLPIIDGKQEENNLREKINLSLDETMQVVLDHRMHFFYNLDMVKKLLFFHRIGSVDNDIE